ncbi:MAG: CRISPR-associated endonuclease Cas3'' [Pyrobaculum sp.]
MSDWPLAAERVNLQSHLSKVAELSICLFEGELDILARKTGWGDVRTAMWLSGYFHDVGKASRYYKERWEEGGRLSFPYHEYLSAIMLMELSNTDDDRLMCIYKTSAKVVARHHTAMAGRHPSMLYGQLAEVIKKALEGLEVEDVAKVLQGVGHVGNMAQDIRQRMGDVIREAKGMEVGEITGIVEDLAILNERVEVCGGLNELLTVRTLTGLLIIADNLAAGVEGRNPEDQPVPLYTRYWARELRPRLKRCVEIVPGVDRLALWPS